MNPIDIPDIAEKFGPFVALAAAVILTLGIVVRALWTRLNAQTDARMADHKEHANQLMENAKMLDQARQFIEGASRAK